MIFPKATQYWKDKFLNLIETAGDYIPEYTLEDYFAMDDYRESFRNTRDWFDDIKLGAMIEEYWRESLYQYIAEKIQDDFDKWMWDNNPDIDLSDDEHKNADGYTNADECIFGFNDFLEAVCNTFTLEELKNAVGRGIAQNKWVIWEVTAPDGSILHVKGPRRD